MSVSAQLFPVWISRWLFSQRLVRFGTVGASGVPVNLGVLYLSHEFLFAAVEPPGMRLNLGLALAIFCATLNNFTWNRLWTWGDRRRELEKHLVVQFGQYASACWVSIALQVIFTKLLAVYVHFLVANLTAIVLASGFNFLVQHFWTFRRRAVVFQTSAGSLAASPSDGLPVGIHRDRVRSGLTHAWYGLALVLAVFTYCYALDSQHIPKNGDEYPYEHITRLTAQSGALLPLQSDLDGMRNTKPPLLFWQGIASTKSGQDWTLWNLRYPSVVYTLLTAALAFLLAWKLSGRVQAGMLAALVFLGFFSTYRYGRPFLTNPPEVFWLFLPFFVLLYWRAQAFASRLAVPVGLGIAVGIGLLYKSFALVLPVTLALAWWYLHVREYRTAAFLAHDAYKIALVGLIALGMFGLWFLLDPNPQAVWQEFVVRENVGKFDPHDRSYLSKLLWGGSSLWSHALGYPLNAGLLAFPVAALLIFSYRRRDRMSESEKLLWIWVITLFVVFALPSQRSSRYILAAMPALAVLCALNWNHIGRTAFVATLVACGAAIALMGYLASQLHQEFGAVEVYTGGYWLLLASAGALTLAGIAVPRLTRAVVPVVVLLSFVSLAAFLRPFDADLGTYSVEARQYASGREVWVPCDFRAKDERYRFILPDAHIHGYHRHGVDLGTLEARYPLFAVQLPLAAGGCSDCKVIGERLDLRGRHSGAELREMLLHGKIMDNLFVRELLVESSRAPATPARATGADACR